MGMNGVSRVIEPLRRLLKMIASKAVIDSVDDSQAMQTVQVIVGKNEVLGDVERVQPFGLSSVPAAGDEAIVVLIGGEREHAVVIACDSTAKRPTGLQEGEVCVYRDNKNRITFKANGDIDIECEGTVNVKASDIRLGDGSSHAGVMLDSIITKFNSHTHPGVTSGSASTGVPATLYAASDATSKTKAE
jgi:phage gp45-like